jgi:phosphomannomutase
MECPEDVKGRLMEKLKNQPPSVLAGKKVVEVKPDDGVKFVCDDQSWLLLRFSGTEPIMRIYAEGRSRKQVNELIAYGKEAAAKA